MIFGHANYRSCIRAELAERIGINPAYSLRTFAMELEMAHSTLSEILKGKKNLSQASALRVARKLNLATPETEYFLLLVQLETSKDPDFKQQVLDKLAALNPGHQSHDLSLDYFRTISDWYHYPIMEMTYLHGFQFTPKNIAQRLGITATEAEAALERLLRLELIEKMPEGNFRKTTDYLVARPPANEPALKKFNLQMLQLAMKAIQEQPPTERLTGTETFSISRTQLPEARDIMETFFKTMTALTQSPLPKTDVYHLNVQMFNLTQTPNPSLERKTKP